MSSSLERAEPVSGGRADRRGRSGRGAGDVAKLGADRAGPRLVWIYCGADSSQIALVHLIGVNASADRVDRLADVGKQPGADR